MKTTHLLAAGLLAGVGIALPIRSAHAQATVSYTPGDLLLGFEEPGNSNDYILDLGPVTYFNSLAQTAGATTNLTTALSLGNFAGDLATVFGNTWYANSATQGSNVQWGAIAVSSNFYGGTNGSGPNAVLGLPQGTIYVTKAETNPGTQSTAPAEGSLTFQDNVIGKANSFDTDAFDGSNSGDSPVGAEVPGASPGWTSYDPSANAFGLGYGIEQPQGAGITAIGPTNSELDLYELLPSGATGSTGSGGFLGSFTLDSSGDLDFTTAAASVPEPSTYSAIGLGAALLLLSRRTRKSNA